MLHTLRALGYPDYRIFLLGQGAALIGIWCQRIALVWLVYSITGSPLLLGLVAFASEIPFLILSPVGGVIAENIRDGVVRHVNSCFFTMVAVDDAHKPVAVPPLEPTTEEEKRRFAAARLRRQLRKETERRLQETRAQHAL